MINWNDLDQVGDTLWDEHKEIEDHIVPQPNERDGNSFSKFEKCSEKQKSEDDCKSMISSMETYEIKNNFLICNAKNGSNSSTFQELNDASVDMDTWPDLPNLSMAYGGCFSDGIGRDSVITGLASDFADTSDLKSIGGFMEGYNHPTGLLHDKDSSSLSKTSFLLSGNEMQLDFGHDDKENDKFMDYDWANIEDFDDLDKMFRYNDSIFENEMIDNTDAFLAASAELISCTSQSIPVPDIPISREQDWEEDSSSHYLGEHSDVKAKLLQNGKADMENQTLKTKENLEQKRKSESFQGQESAMNPRSTLQSQPFMLADYGYPTYQFRHMPLPPQIRATKDQHKAPPGGFKAHLDFSKHAKPVGTSSKPLLMTPREKIEKLRRRQKMQAMIAIQKQREQYNHQISGADEAPSLSSCLQNNQNQVVEEKAQMLSSSDASNLAEQDQSQMISSSLDGRSVEEAIYYQLHDAMEKLDMNVRLSIRDSLYRLARSAMERQKNSDRSSTNKSSKEEEEISADNQERHSSLLDSEAVTNPIDRVVAHLLFHNPSGSSLIPIADSGMSMATSM